MDMHAAWSDLSQLQMQTGNKFLIQYLCVALLLKYFTPMFQTLCIIALIGQLEHASRKNPSRTIRTGHTGRCMEANGCEERATQVYL